jgi:hypothetical protein
MNKFIITTNDYNTFTNVLWYITKLENTNKNLAFINGCIHKDKLNNKDVNFIAYDNDFNFTFKNIEFNLKQKKFDKTPMPSHYRGDFGYYEEIYITPIDKNIDKDLILKTIKDFILESCEKYRENTRFRKESDKITLWAYSECFWEDIKQISTRDINTVILDDEFKNKIMTSIDKYDNTNYKNKLKSLGINNKLNIIFEGLPGTGKTSMMRAIATKLNKDIATIDFNQPDLNDNKFIKAFIKIPDDCICVFEDFETLFLENEKSRDNKISFSCILNFLDGMYTKSDLLTIITTNHLNKIDNAIKRPMRIDHIFNFTYCTKFQTKKMFEIIYPDSNNFNKLYNIIKNKKYTTCMLQKWFITYLDDDNELIENIKYFEELITMITERETNMFS